MVPPFECPSDFIFHIPFMEEHGLDFRMPGFLQRLQVRAAACSGSGSSSGSGSGGGCSGGKRSATTSAIRGGSPRLLPRTVQHLPVPSTRRVLLVCERLAAPPPTAAGA